MGWGLPSKIIAGLFPSPLTLNVRFTKNFAESLVL